MLWKISKKKLGKFWKVMGKVKDKPQEMLPFQKSLVSYLSFWYLADGGASKGGSFDSDINKHDDTLVKNW